MERSMSRDDCLPPLGGEERSVQLDPKHQMPSIEDQILRILAVDRRGTPESVSLRLDPVLPLPEVVVYFRRLDLCRKIRQAKKQVALDLPEEKIAYEPIC